MTDAVLKHNSSTKRLFYIVALLCVVCATVYVYFIQAAVVRAVARDKMVSTISVLRSETAHLEAEYFALDQTVTVERAQALGFSEPLNIAYAERGVISGLSLYHNAR